MFARNALFLGMILLLTACDLDDDDGDAAPADTAAPVLDSSIPAHMQNDADTQPTVFLFYGEAIASNLTDGALELKNAETDEVIPAAVDVRGATVILTPSQKLAYSTEYLVESTVNIADAAGNAAEPVLLSFTTRDIEVPSPAITYSPADGEFVAPSGEMYMPVSAERIAFHAEHHSYFPVVTATLPALFDDPVMASIQDYVIERDEMVVINPAQDEFLWVMEGKRHGFDNLAIVLTHTVPGNGAPLHTHIGEEAHVLLEGQMRYFLGDEEAVVDAPYILNIPSMVPHAFMNVGDEPAKIVGIFPESQNWEYDILDANVFADSHEAGSEKPSDSGLSPEEWLKAWHGQESRERRLKAHKLNQL